MSKDPNDKTKGPHNAPKDEPEGSPAETQDGDEQTPQNPPPPPGGEGGTHDPKDGGGNG
jgi:hypothetical protein